MTWVDQPEWLEKIEKLASGFSVGHYVAEVYFDPYGRNPGHGPWYIVLGDLFGSETYECADARSVFALIQRALEPAWQDGSARYPLPVGVKSVRPAS
jgi:hypothetical protein